MKEITPVDLRQWLSEERDFMLVDVREPFERESFHIGGLHIPLGDIIVRKEELRKDIPVVVYCAKGIRSSIVIQRLEQFGFDNLYNLSGGMSAWKKTEA